MIHQWLYPMFQQTQCFFHCSITFWWLNYSSFWWHSISGWWFGTFCVFPYIGNNHPNWLIFFRRVETTNQYKSWDVYHLSTGDSNFAPIVERYVAGSHSCKDTWGYLRVFHPILFPSRILAWMFHWDWDYIFPFKKNKTTFIFALTRVFPFIFHEHFPFLSHLVPLSLIPWEKCVHRWFIPHDFHQIQ